MINERKLEVGVKYFDVKKNEQYRNTEHKELSGGTQKKEQRTSGSVKKIKKRTIK